MADFAKSFEQKDWERALDSYSRSKRALEFAYNLNHVKSIEYWQKNIEGLEKKYPILRT